MAKLDLNLDAYRLIAECLHRIRQVLRDELRGLHGEEWAEVGLPEELRENLSLRRSHEASINWHSSDSADLLDYAGFSNIYDVVASSPDILRRFASLAPDPNVLHPGISAGLLGITPEVDGEHYNRGKRFDAAGRFLTGLAKEREETAGIAERHFRGRLDADATRPGSLPEAAPAPAGASPPAIPDHELLQCIGRGSYGEVWLARDVLGQYRAVKVVHRTRFDSDHAYEREFEGLKRYEPVSRGRPQPGCRPARRPPRRGWVLL